MVALENEKRNNSCDVEHTDRIVVTYYTDPLCCWSWAFEPAWERFCREYHGQIEYHYVMGGMIADWKTFSDPVSDVSSPAQMGPVWMHVGAVAHVPINYNLWHTDPPGSSYPACIAIRNAFLQSHAAGELYLKAVRRAVMTEARNVARQEVLTAIAGEVAQQHPQVFSAEAFASAFHQAAARHAFRADLQKVAFQKIGRFPTLTFVKSDGKGLVMTGSRPFVHLQDCMALLTQPSQA